MKRKSSWRDPAVPHSILLFLVDFCETRRNGGKTRVTNQEKVVRINFKTCWTRRTDAHNQGLPEGTQGPEILIFKWQTFDMIPIDFNRAWTQRVVLGWGGRTHVYSLFLGEIKTCFSILFTVVFFIPRFYKTKSYLLHNCWQRLNVSQCQPRRQNAC